MSRSTLLQEQADWMELQQCRGWARLVTSIADLVQSDRQALETMTPDGVTMPRAQGRIEARKEIVGDEYTGALSYPARRIDELKKQLEGAE